MQRKIGICGGEFEIVRSGYNLLRLQLSDRTRPVCILFKKNKFNKIGSNQLELQTSHFDQALMRR